MKKLPKQKLLLKLLEYNQDTGTLTWKIRGKKFFKSDRDMKIWNTRFAGKKAFATCNDSGYFVGCIFYENFLAHRIIWKMCFGEDPKCIDHINGNRCDNRLSNLRSVSFTQNNRNARLPSHNKSGVSGVCRDNDRNKWIATITVGNEPVRLGRFDDFKEACLARKKAEKKYGFHENHGRVS